MGLGKTLQSITLLYTLMTQGFEKGQPVAKRSIVCCPTSLVANWKKELTKWTQDKIDSIGLSEPSREKVIQGIDEFLNPRSKSRILIISYETFRMHKQRFLDKKGCCDLMIWYIFCFFFCLNEQRF